MGFSEQRQPTKTTGLDHRQIKIGGLGVSDPFTFLLHQQTQPEVVKLGHLANPYGPTLAMERDLPTPPDVAFATSPTILTGLVGLEPTTYGLGSHEKPPRVRGK